jgi:hypothetical protein
MLAEIVTVFLLFTFLAVGFAVWFNSEGGD